MTFETKDGEGSLFKNDRKESCFEDLMGALKRTVVGV